MYLASGPPVLLFDPVGDSGPVEGASVVGGLKRLGGPGDYLLYGRMLLLEEVLEGSHPDDGAMGPPGSVAREKFLSDVREEWSAILERWLESVEQEGLSPGSGGTA